MASHLRVKDLAARASVSERTVRRWVADGKLPVEHDETGSQVIAEEHVHTALRLKNPHYRAIDRVVVSLSNNKGGVGKTASAVNIARELSDYYSVLLVDFDPQSNATAATVENLERVSFLDHLESGRPLEELIIKADAFDVMPSHLSLERLELDTSVPQSELIVSLREALAPIESYQVIIIDTLPSLGLLQRMAICAAEGVLIPVKAGTFAVDGIYNLQQLILNVRQEYGASAELMGIFLTMYDHRKTMSRAILEALREEFPDYLFSTVIRENTAVDQALSLGVSVGDFTPGSNGAIDYHSLAMEVIAHAAETAKR